MKLAPRSKLATTAVLAASALALGACLTPTQTSTPNISPFYSAQVVGYVTSGGAMPLEVRGQPFAGMKAEKVTADTARRLKLPDWFATREFAPAPIDGAPSGNYRTVIVFNSAELTTDSDDVCRASDKIEVTPPGNRVNVIAAFCAGEEVITDTYGSTVASGPDSGEYRTLLAQITFALFPRRNIDTEIGDDIPVR
jgi:hypothetical protein